MNPTTNTEAGAVADVAAWLTEAQRAALLDAIKFLEAVADEGIGHDFSDGTTLYGDEVIYHLFNAFLPDWDGEGTYTDTLAQHLEQGATAGVVGGKEAAGG